MAHAKALMRALVGGGPRDKELKDEGRRYYPRVPRRAAAVAGSCRSTPQSADKSGGERAAIRESE
jgi:hypothetical protein